MTKQWTSRMRDGLRRLHRDEQGADMLEYILILAAIALPVLGVILYFWNDIKVWVGEAYEDIRSGEGTDPLD